MSSSSAKITNLFDTSTLEKAPENINGKNSITINSDIIKFEKKEDFDKELQIIRINNMISRSKYTDFVYNIINQDNYTSHSFERKMDMDSNNLLEKYIEKVDRDQSDLRADIRASEERTSKNITEVQQRMDNRLNRIEDLISKQNDSFETKFNKLENKIDTKIDLLEGKIDGNKKFMWGIVVTIVVSCVATAISVASMNNSLVQIVQNLVSLVK
jgi:predicted  nucleic acid-binding Zn-ribbon protein